MTELHGGDLLAASQRYGLPPEAFLDFSANINPAGPPPGVAAAINGAMHWIAHYPEPFARTLAAELAGREGIDPLAVLVGNGAAEVLYLALRLGRGRPCVIPTPAFAEYERAAVAAGSRVVPFPLDAAAGFRVDPMALAAAAERSGAGLVVLNNPHNPSGAVLTAPEVLKLADRLALSDAYLVVDEAFVDFLGNPAAHTLIRVAAQSSHLVVVRSLTKFYALPGLRVGYAVALPSVVQELNAQRDPWSAGALAQVAARAALADQDYADRTRSWVASERPWLATALAGIPGLRICPPSANYILVEATGTGCTAAELQARLGRQGILIRNGAGFAGLTAQHFRVAVRSRAENEKLVAALGAATHLVAAGEAYRRDEQERR